MSGQFERCAQAGNTRLGAPLGGTAAGGGGRLAGAGAALAAELAGPSIVTLPLLGGGASGAGGGSPVFVAGATGGTGSKVVQRLVDAGYGVRAGFRSRRKAQWRGLGELEGVSLAPCDLTAEPAQLAEQLRGSRAAVCAAGTGLTSLLDPQTPRRVDYGGVVNLVDACKLAGVRRFVLVSSILTNARAVGQENDANFQIINTFGGVFDWKLEAERYLRASGLDYTIVRPGDLVGRDLEGPILVADEDTLFDGYVSRDQVARVVVAALGDRNASRRVVEVISTRSDMALAASGQLRASIF